MNKCSNSVVISTGNYAYLCSKSKKTNKFNYKIIPKNSLLFHGFRDKTPTKYINDRPVWFGSFTDIIGGYAPTLDRMYGYRTKHDLKLLNLGDKKNLKSLLELIEEMVLSEKNVKKLEELIELRYIFMTLTGYGITSYSNPNCGYFSKPKFQPAFCAHDANNPPFGDNGYDLVMNEEKEKVIHGYQPPNNNYRNLIFAKWLCTMSTKLDIDGWILDGVNVFDVVNIKYILDAYLNKEIGGITTTSDAIKMSQNQSKVRIKKEIMLCNMHTSLKYDPKATSQAHIELMKSRK